MQKYPQLQTKLSNASNVVNNQLEKLRILEGRFNTLDAELHNKLITNIKNGDNCTCKSISQ